MSVVDNAGQRRKCVRPAATKGENVLKRTIAMAVALLAASAATALAVVNGSPDNGRHPYVGMAVWFPTGNPANGFELCSGSLVSATVFVTAAHCFPEGAHVLVDFQDDAFADLHNPGFGSAVPGTAHPDPHWTSLGNGLSQFDRNDVAVVKLAGSGVTTARYAQLPALGYDDTLPNNQPVELLGYGLQQLSPQVFGSRIDAPAKIVPGGGATSSEFLKVSSSPGQGGATCNGDSGGPILQGGTDLMLAINSYGASAQCTAVAYAQRVDTPDAHAFITGFMP
jgi:Trypsin